ncbi:MAG: F0F1 ATP synthase subunit delta [bacterium]|nr:F0F1 ATP synthase subunit delta [bacterium]
MRYPAEAYAKAFSEALTEHPSKKDHIIKSFLGAVSKNGDWPAIEKILNLITQKITHGSGGRVVSAEFARPLSDKMISEFKKQFPAGDHVEISVKPGLIAGVRVLVDGEKELDMTLAKKINKLLQ